MICRPATLIVSCPAADQNVMTEMRYGLGGQLAQLVAKKEATGDQVTRYEYGRHARHLRSGVQLTS